MCGGGETGGANNRDNDDKKGSGNSFKEGLANILTPGDGFSYVDGRLTATNDRDSYTPVDSSNPNEARNSVTVSNNKGGLFQVPKNETKKYNDGLVVSAIMGAMTGGLPGIIGGVAGNAMQNNMRGGSEDSKPKEGFKGMFQPGGLFAGPKFDTPEEEQAYQLEQKNKAIAAGRSRADGSDNNDDRVRQTVTTPTDNTGIAGMSDMSAAAAQGAFQSIPNPDYDPNDPMSPRFLINPSYEQLLEYKNQQLLNGTPVPMRNGGLAQFAEGGELEVAPPEGGNEKTEIADAVSAVKGDMSEEEASVVLGKFLANYGEEALRDLVEKVKSGEYDDTKERFANGEAGEVNGPGDGSGVDDKVPASLEGQEDVLLADGEYVLRAKTAKALEKMYGGGFLDTINESEDNAPRVIRELAARTA
tara:strand:- start:3536 stop:4783 length:1248 start_codon:yes stop_codon:yes gene_type:complete